MLGEVERLRRENEKLTAALAAAKRENQELKDEIRRLKGLPPRPPMRPSGMETATERPAPETPSAPDASPPRRRGPGEAEHRPHGDAAGVGAGGIAPQGL